MTDEVYYSDDDGLIMIFSPSRFVYVQFNTIVYDDRCSPLIISLYIVFFSLFGDEKDALV